MLKLKNNKIIGFPVKNLPEGVLAVIVDCCINSYIGEIVQRYKDTLIGIDGGLNHYWENVSSMTEDFKVRLLESGEELVIEGY